MIRKTSRGFLTVRTPVKSCHQHPTEVRLVQSSAAFCGHEHIWLFLDGKCITHLGEHVSPSAHLSLKSAKRLHAQLAAMIERLETK